MIIIIQDVGARGEAERAPEALGLKGDYEEAEREGNLHCKYTNRYKYRQKER